ncbi:hypothetical protein Q5P01_001128 [Channa striata]|uniref:Uncharacterized protein n=1 Tax=Channa striata TaxID=64152 RepID=A0AA88NLR9_CHASR|nr:hypothetical protein Q5P01_001128 [Channa striata]
MARSKISPAVYLGHLRAEAEKPLRAFSVQSPTRHNPPDLTSPQASSSLRETVHGRRNRAWPRHQDQDRRCSAAEA